MACQRKSVNSEKSLKVCFDGAWSQNFRTPMTLGLLTGKG